VDSNSEESDSDLSDVGAIDSDLEQEKQVSYQRSIYREDAVKMKKLMKEELGAGKKRKMAPADSLKLEFVHGYVRFLPFCEVYFMLVWSRNF
jgi:hypothetical protein